MAMPFNVGDFVYPDDAGEFHRCTVPFVNGQ